MTGPLPPPSAAIQDVDPFAIDPWVLGWLRRRNVRPVVVTLCAVIATVFFTTYASSLAGLMSQDEEDGLPAAGFSTFLSQRAVAGATKVPLFSDVPSLLLAFCIPISIGTVYALFVHVASLHSDMHNSGCLAIITPTGTATSSPGIGTFNAHVTALNNEFDRKRRSAFALLVSFAFAAVVNLTLKDNLFNFSGSEILYEQWWASLNPFRVGGIVWVILGGLGIYVVYAEAVLGLKYISFLRKHSAEFRFRANAANPDGYFGWMRLRAVISNLQVGIVLTAFSALAMSYFLLPGVGRFIGSIVLAAFVGTVGYVFIVVTSSFKRHVAEDKAHQIGEIEGTIAGLASKRDVSDLLILLTSYEKLKLVQRLPAVPMRRAWLVAGLLTAGVPTVALVLQFIQYLTDLSKG